MSQHICMRNFGWVRRKQLSRSLPEFILDSAPVSPGITRSLVQWCLRPSVYKPWRWGGRPPLAHREGGGGLEMGLRVGCRSALNLPRVFPSSFSWVSCVGDSEPWLTVSVIIGIPRELLRTWLNAPELLGSVLWPLLMLLRFSAWDSHLTLVMVWMFLTGLHV